MLLLASLVGCGGAPEAPVPCVATAWYADLDGDGVGGAVSGLACAAPAGWVATGGDCDDGDPGVLPGAAESCNGRDEDCDGAVDEDAVDQAQVYADADGDGWGDADRSELVCTLGEGEVAVPGDCDDADAAAFPGATEVCDGIDEDCDGAGDVGAIDAPMWFGDADGDGWGDAAAAIVACEAPAGAVADDTDCDDGDPAVFPGAPTTCAGDADCDGRVGDADPDVSDPATWYADADGDGHGNTRVSRLGCDAPAGFVASADDCDDADAAVHPGAGEVCAGGDEDCDGLLGDDDPDVADAPAWYPDTDGDGYGAAPATRACVAPAGSVADASDCDDTDAAVSPAAVERCAAGDEDCDGLDGDADPDVSDPRTWYADVDADLWGDEAVPVVACVPTGASGQIGDCDDADATVYPFAAEVCEDGVDQDCFGGDQSCALLGDWGLAAADATLLGAGGAAGTTVAAAGDINGDGLDDLLVGAESFDGTGAQRGAVYVADGAGSGRVDLAGGAGTILALADGGHFGSGIAGIGDTDGDGLADIVVGAYLADPSYAGDVWLFAGVDLPGPGASIDTSAAAATFPGLDAYDYTGNFLIDCGDTDGDGRGDLLVGATGDSTTGYHAGATYLVLGRAFTGAQDLGDAQAVFLGEGAGSHSAGAADGLGDWNGDGLDDLLVAAEAHAGTGSLAGTVYVLYSPQSGTVGLADADFRVQGEAAGDLAGTSAAGAGDTDGDGYADLVVGATGNTRGGFDAGAAYVVRGPQGGELNLSAADAILVGAAAGDLAGYAVAGPGDLDGDGLDDVAVGAPHDSTLGTFFGAVSVVYGPLAGVVGLADADATLRGYASAGSALSPAGDTDGDGYLDLLIGGPADTAGVAWLVRGRAR